jgi:hypothetical protein
LEDIPVRFAMSASFVASKMIRSLLSCLWL